MSVRAELRSAALLAVAVLAAVALGSFLSVLPPPFSRLDIGLLLACSLVAVFRPTEASLLALASGLLTESLSGTMPGLRFAAGLLAILAANAFFRRFLANLSWPAFAALNALAFAGKGILLGLLASFEIRLSGAVMPLPLLEWLQALAIGAIFQAGLAVLALGTVRSLYSWIRSRYLYASHVRP